MIIRGCIAFVSVRFICDCFRFHFLNTITMAGEMKDSKMAKDNEQYYILLKEAYGEKKGKGFGKSTFRKEEKKFVSLVSGEILVKHKEQLKERTMSMLRLSPFEKPSVLVECMEKDVARLDNEETNLLLPLSSMTKRLEVFQNRERLEAAKKIVVGSPVWVNVSTTKNSEYKGVVKYAGPLPGSNGTWFGVELVVGVNYVNITVDFLT